MPKFSVAEPFSVAKPTAPPPLSPSFSSEKIPFTLFLLLLPLLGLLLFPFARKTTKQLQAFFLQLLFYFSSLFSFLLLKGLFFLTPYFLEFLLPFLWRFAEAGLVLGYVFLAVLLLWSEALFERTLRRLPLLSQCYFIFRFFMFSAWR